ncbi:YqzE family protein [Bacillus sp. Bva_UNVM-123]|uniref:YqzE family protein n=1 Tax=Bacillus sp. Bva_UNVM-123 TaxID=2829798 RepID=UPI00391EF358
MNTNDYVKYITQTVIKYIDQPKEERKRQHIEKKEMKEPFLLKWFGILPYIFYDQVKRKYRKKRPI